MPPKLDLRAIEALTFDCYGTLIDWLTGIRTALHGLPGLAGADLDRLLVDREDLELQILSGPYRRYREVLAISLDRAAREQGIELTESELASLFDGMGAWPPFQESRSALERLAARYRLAILSNVESAVLEYECGEPMTLAR